MNARWRDYIELAGILSVVGGLLLVTLEVRQANQIARAQTVLDLQASYNQLNLANATDSDFARLRYVMQDPTSYEISDIEKSKITAVAYHTHNIAWSAQQAYESGLLDQDDLEVYRHDLEMITNQMPGLVPDLLSIYEAQTWKQDAIVFEPLRRLLAEKKGVAERSQ